MFSIFLLVLKRQFVRETIKMCPFNVHILIQIADLQIAVIFTHFVVGRGRDTTSKWVKI